MNGYNYTSQTLNNERVKHYWLALRLKEITGKAGFFMIGVLLARPDITSFNLVLLLKFTVICFLNGMAVYLINAGFGHPHDLANSRLKTLHEGRPVVYLMSGVLIMASSLFLLYLFSVELFFLGLIIHLLWIVYSLPNGLKSIPVMGLLCAFLAQLIHFHVGYMVFFSWNRESILLSVYFALLFAGGHALHEVIDFDADKHARLQTSAVFYGKDNVLKVSHFLFMSGALYLLIIVSYLSFPWYSMMPYVFAFILQLYFIMNLPAEWRPEDLFIYRRRYMLSYLLATAAVALIIYQH